MLRGVDYSKLNFPTATLPLSHQRLWVIVVKGEAVLEERGGWPGSKSDLTVGA